ncbi:MAG: DUF2357 domain-containing protein [Rhodoferax sp.]|uniref:DUF2357 domain-containing protein n=1 Tax=Rhodoferax sp. TaxID=50421 RepID=UPI0026365182|nr:DUF2357 domain-containing protein [Rhodoferax sp.]MDD2883097.1 DUF2357 domain-containing protein [Rhodoferax sp.]
MTAEPIPYGEVECRTPEGRLLATVKIATLTPAVKEPHIVQQRSLIMLSGDEARQNSEERLQLRERGRYEYRLKPVGGEPLELTLLEDRCVHPSPVESDRGLIEPQDYCGLLPLTVISRYNPDRPLARGSIEVRSVKLGYREHYRGMLTCISKICAGLLMDCRAPTRLKLDTLWRDNHHIIEQQLEFLRYTLESSPFRSAIDEVLRNPHRRLEDNREERDISRPFKPGRDFARQIAVASRRVEVPEGHPLRSAGIRSLPAKVSVQSRTDFLDTAENRFVKMVLSEFRDFLADVASHLTRRTADIDKPETRRLLGDANRLRGMLETQLGRGFLPEISPPAVVPLGSPALQRKSGYRELLHFWLQFHAGAQLSWEGSADVFEAGARNVATLYEYWLFFQLEKLFRQRFSCDKPLHSIIVDKEKAPPQLMLKRGVELRTPVAGTWSNTASRRLNAEFHFNRKFCRRHDQDKAGSWSRGVQPDYTISIWPAEYSREDAERNELMAHIHFDAKYRVDSVRELLGDTADDDAFESGADKSAGERTAAKYSDLLKMHAYRDAVRRTAGAYVLYPGNPGDDVRYNGYHEVLPGLGAFAVRPSAEGEAAGIEAVSKFLDDVINHLANRTTARERVTYHLAEAYTAKEQPVSYGALVLPESDIYGSEFRALPPAEEMVLIAWYGNDAQLDLARDEDGLYYVRLGSRRGALHIHPNLAMVRSVILHANATVFATGMLKLREPGFRIYTKSELRAVLERHAKGKGVASWQAAAGADDDEQIYALFKTAENPDTSSQPWDSRILMDEIERFESDERNKPVVNVGRTSPYPRILPLRDVLKARY